jgi:hypothetical protein
MDGSSSRVEARRRAGQWLPAFQPFRASWQMAIRPFTPFPPPPLKFRTAGFPQYGFKRAFEASPSPTLPARTYKRLHSSSGVHPHFVRLFGLASHPNVLNTDSDALVQWPLAPQPVIVSGQIIAYYDHIRDAAAPTRLMDYSLAVLGPPRFPNLICLSF